MTNSDKIKELFYTKYKSADAVRENILSILENQISDHHYQIIYQESVEDGREIFEVLVPQIGESQTRKILGNIFLINPDAGNVDIETFVADDLDVEDLIKYQTGEEDVRKNSNVQE